MQLSTKQLDILRQYDTPTVSNVIELYDVRPRTAGYMDKSIRCRFPELPPMVGYASTATFRCGSPKGPESYGSLEKQVIAFGELPGPPVVVFEDLDQPLVAATFGEIMCTTYQAFGAQGLITSGAGRDLEQVRDLKFPVFTDQVICSHGYSQIPSVHVPVQVGGLSINPGDLLHGDLNGVVLIPDAIASEIGDACALLVKAESIILDYLKGGDVTTQGLVQAQAECSHQISLITNRNK